MLSFNLSLVKFYFLWFKIIIIHYHTLKQKKRKFQPRMKLNHKVIIILCSVVYNIEFTQYYFQVLFVGPAKITEISIVKLHCELKC